jgi:acetyltransferase-like isoleucine patch superfamily enzyme
MINSFYSENELDTMGFKSYGKNVLISRKASIYYPGLMSIGNFVRIDDFCILSGNISLGSYIHISAYSALYGKYGINMNDFSGLSPRCTVFSATDDFSGEFLVNPMIYEKFRHVTGGEVILGKFVQIGAGSIIMPNIIINEGAAIAALSFVNKSIEEWTIAGGIPAKVLKARSKEMATKAKLFISSLDSL